VASVGVCVKRKSVSWSQAVGFVKMAVFWDIAMMEAVSTCQTSVKFYEITWCNIPEDYQLHTRRHENLKSRCRFCVCMFGRNMASVAVNMSSHLIYFIKKCYKRTLNVICNDNAVINCITVQ
jgi:hypothetical protein